MQTYLELKVPLVDKAEWMTCLKDRLSCVPVKWQNGYYHITLAFIDETPDGIDLVPIISKHLRTDVLPELTFDTIDAFTANKAGMHIVNLTVSTVPEEFQKLVANIRQDLKLNGCVMESDFRLHVTLGRLDAANVDISELQGVLRKVPIPKFRLKLTTFEYRKFRGESIKVWNLVKK